MYDVVPRNYWTAIREDEGRLKVIGTKPWAEARKFIDVTAGKKYRLRYNADLGNCAYLHIIVYNPADGSYVWVPSSGGITSSGNYNDTFTASADNLEIRFQMPALPTGESTGYFYLDDIYLEEVVAYEDGESENGGRYRYQFNGKELDKEVSATTTYDYGFRIYSPGLGRFLSVDPITKKYPELTPYQFASNRPFDGIDLDGLEYFNMSKEDRQKLRIATRIQKDIDIHNRIIESIARKIQPKVVHDPQSTAPAPLETIKQAIGQFVWVQTSIITNETEIAFLIPDKEGKVSKIFETTYEGLKDLQIIDKSKEIVLDKLRGQITNVGSSLIDMSKLAKGSNGKYVLNVLGKSLKLSSRLISVANIVTEIVDAREGLKKGELPFPVSLLQSNPAIVTSEDQIKSAINLYGKEIRPEYSPVNLSELPRPTNDHSEDVQWKKNIPKINNK